MNTAERVIHDLQQAHIAHYRAREKQVNLTAIQTSVISLVVAVAGIAGALGFCDTDLEKLIVSTASVVIPLAFQLYIELERKTVTQARIAGLPIRSRLP